MGQIVPWGEWKPDLSHIQGNDSPTITNVFPRADGYGPAPGLTALSVAMPAACRGFFTAFDTDGTISLFSGTANRLLKMSNTNYNWLDLSKTNATKLTTTGLTKIGDVTGGGGLAAVFDGTTAQAAAACGTKAAATTCYAGLTLSAAAAIRSVKIYGSNDAGYVSAINPNITAKLYASNTLPANGTNGTLLATLTPFADTADEHVARTITSTDLQTQYLYVWVYFSQDGAANQMNIAEIEVFTAADYASVNSTDHWQYTQFARRIIAVQANVAPQTFLMGTDSIFSDLAGTPPDAAYCATVNEFVVLSGLTSDPFTIQWSSISNPTEWTAGTNQGDTQSFRNGGLVRGVAGGEFGLVFQDNAIRRMTYSPGSTLVFEFDLVSDDIGLFAPYSLVQVRGVVFFLSAVGFYRWDQLNGFVPIGKERVDRTFFNDCDTSQPQLIIGGADPTSSRVFWSYKSTSNGSNSYFDRLIIYDWSLDRWSGFVNIDGEYIASSATPGTTLESLDTINSSIDALGGSLDDYPAQYGRKFAVADNTHKIGLLTGSNLEATLETPDMEQPTRMFVRGARPVTDSPTVYGSVGSRQRAADSVTYSTETTMNTVGFTPHRVDGRLIRLKNRIPAATSWSYTVGVEPDMVSSGQR